MGLKDIAGGLLPGLLGRGGKNAGFALGIAPGLLYQKKYEDDEEEQRMAAAKQAAAKQATADQAPAMKKGGSVKASSASRRADGIATKGKTRGRLL